MKADGPEIIHGDCIEAMLSMGDNTVDAIVTDPPYGLGFMGKTWDKLPPGKEWAEECLRVLKPGGHLLAFGGTRTWHRVAVAVEDAGFEIRDSIAWMYGSGFPKHRAALKPAFEPIVMARKPYKGSLVANEALHGTGALNVDRCRIEGTPEPTRFDPKKHGHEGWRMKATGAETAEAAKAAGGRWPANVVLDEAMADVLNTQTAGMRASKPSKSGTTRTQGDPFTREQGDRHAVNSYGDSGGASRFFYVAKPSKAERPLVGGVTHPTVKPLDLMRWLVKLVTPTGGTVLEPFAGSGATVEACLLEGFHCIAIEREAEYLPLIQQRIERVS